MFNMYLKVSHICRFFNLCRSHLTYHSSTWWDFKTTEMTWQFEYPAFLNTFGKFCRIASLGSQTTRACSNNWRNNLIQVVNVHERNASDMQNLSAKSSLSITWQNFIGDHKSSSFCVNFFELLWLSASLFLLKSLYVLLVLSNRHYLENMV